MPVYEFTCDACGETFEIISSLADRDEKAVCPACGGRDVKPVFSSVSLGGSRSSVNPECSCGPTPRARSRTTKKADPHEGPGRRRCAAAWPPCRPAVG